MAEAIARDLAKRGELDALPDARSIFFASAGIAAWDGSPISVEAQQTLKAMGIEHDGHAKRLTAEMIRKASLVLGMTEAHVLAARRLVTADAEQEEKIQRLDPTGDVEDPIGLGHGAYHALSRRFRKMLPGRIAAAMSSPAGSTKGSR